MIYMDNSATSPVNNEVLEEMKPFFKKDFGNPSTLYSLGQESKKALELARERVANLINASSTILPKCDFSSSVNR